MSIKTKLAALGGATVLGASLSVVGLTVPAQAADHYTWACNSSASDETIYWYNNNTSLGLGSYAQPNECDPTGNWYTYINDIRVDVDVTGGPDRGVDIDSYKIGWVNHGYGSCHEGETDSSNPPDEYWDDGFRYRNYTNGSCS